MSLWENSLVAAYQGGQKANSRPSESEGGDKGIEIFMSLDTPCLRCSVLSTLTRPTLRLGHFLSGQLQRYTQVVCSEQRDCEVGTRSMASVHLRFISILVSCH